VKKLNGTPIVSRYPDNLIATKGEQQAKDEASPEAENDPTKLIKRHHNS
jgi:hypothetical protein